MSQVIMKGATILVFLLNMGIFLIHYHLQKLPVSVVNPRWIQVYFTYAIVFSFIKQDYDVISQKFRVFFCYDVILGLYKCLVTEGSIWILSDQSAVMDLVVGSKRNCNPLPRANHIKLSRSDYYTSINNSQLLILAISTSNQYKQ